MFVQQLLTALILAACVAFVGRRLWLRLHGPSSSGDAPASVHCEGCPLAGTCNHQPSSDCHHEAGCSCCH